MSVLPDRIMNMKLKRSNDRKVANAVSPNGKTPKMANTFGLPSGKKYSCPGATRVCESICYAGKLEKIFKGVKTVVLHNWELLRNANSETMIALIDEMIVDFNKECDKKNAPKLFRIHWDGDFFNDIYTYAWRTVILNHPDIQFWVYTRTKNSAIILKDIPNLSLYFSSDEANIKTGIDLKLNHGIRMAYLAKSFAIGQSDIKEMIGRPIAKCPENTKQIPLISTKGSACVSCGLCVYSKSDVLFSSSKK